MDGFHKKIREMNERTRKSDVDWEKANIRPEEMTYTFGPLMTEEQFKEHCKKTGIKPTILRK